MSATPEESLMHYKDVIYGIDDWHSKTVGVVEGAFDVFRMGKGICTGFGSALTDSQVTKLAERFNRVVFLFDPGDELAWAKAGKHMLELKSMGVNAERVRWASKLDPDELGFKECRILKHQCGIK
jgi:DNA primase